MSRLQAYRIRLKWNGGEKEFVVVELSERGALEKAQLYAVIEERICGEKVEIGQIEPIPKEAREARDALWKTYVEYVKEAMGRW